ncbi:MAG: rhodanese-like domain-containing protein [Bdellovibrionales bacterium]
MKLAAVGLVGLLTLGCQQKPTVGVTEGGLLLENRDYRKVIQPEAVLFDTRSPFEYNTHRVPGSINLIPQDFQVKKDPLDAARRLSLYGVTPETPIVILGDGSGDEAKLAWEMTQLGLRKVETLRVQVFRTLNLRAEPQRPNAIIWKPDSVHGEMSYQEFEEQVMKVGTKTNMSRARVAALQSQAAALNSVDQILIVQVEGQEFPQQKFFFTFERKFEQNTIVFDSEGLLKGHPEWSSFLKRFAKVYLFDSSKDRAARAYALAQWGGRSVWLVDPPKR